jgi:bifunctional DNA-binding transcriptional regulator/antitoxin component of YhaV-PrlF toxin-antitoxin module
VKVTVTINGRGTITLPAKLRRAMRLEADDQLIAEITPEGLLQRPAVTLPIEMYTPEREQEFDAAEAELGAYFGCEKSNRKPTGRAARRRAR